MELQSLERLEQRVSKALERMNQIRQENEELQDQNRELMAKLEKCERDMERLQAENLELREAQKEKELSGVHQEEIRKKIEGMLSKLDTL